MPKYNYLCQSCQHTFDILFLSFRSATEAEQSGIECQKCKAKTVIRNPDPKESMSGGGFRKYGLHTYL